MSSLRLPAELMDHIFDLLRYSIDELESCCLVSKSWVPHARKHLFAAITLHTPENLRSWKTLFPGPSTSPACFIRSLSIDLAHVVTAPDAEEGGWIQTFSHVVHLKVHISKTDSYEGLVPFHGFSPLKSLSIVFFTSPSPRIFNLIYSFPPLENLSVTVYGCFSTIEDDAFDGQPTAIQSPDPPAFTGRLKLYLSCGMDLIAPRLLSLPNGLRFRRLDLRWHSDRDALLTKGLVEKCYSTLESLSIDVGLLSGRLTSCTIDLSNAMKLKDVTLTCTNTRWIAAVLRKLKHGHIDLQQITIDICGLLRHPDFDRSIADPRNAIGEETYERWLELDHLLAQLWESHSIRLKVLYNAPPSMSPVRARGWIECLFPEIVERGIAELTERMPWLFRM